jgi:RNA polymerase sigma-70 factor (ECF subfamily)
MDRYIGNMRARIRQPRGPTERAPTNLRRMVVTREEELEEFDALFRGHYATVAGYSLRRTRSPQDAADVVADTFEIAWRRRTDSGQISLPWLLATARRVMANQRRRDYNRSDVVRRMTVEFDRAMAVQEAPVDEEVLAVLQVFQGLSTGDREVLGLFGWERLGIGTIAAVMEITPNAARVRLHRARARFSQALRDAGVEVAVRPGLGTIETLITSTTDTKGDRHADRP